MKYTNPMPPRTPSRPPAGTPDAPPPFVAIDFKTADYGRDSACALALVRVEAGATMLWDTLQRHNHRSRYHLFQ